LIEIDTKREEPKQFSRMSLRFNDFIKEPLLMESNKIGFLNSLAKSTESLEGKWIQQSIQQDLITPGSKTA
jgi:hypothetical protein